MGTNTGSRRNKYQTQFQPLMSECRDMVIVYTNALLAELFMNADTALLDFAKKAENNELQNRFFEAMNEVQTQRSTIEQRFRENISRNFNGFWSITSSGDGSEEGVILELVEDVKMDESVATENMIARAENSNTSQLYALGQRLAVINSGEMLEQHKLPSSPYHLVSSFQDAITPLNISSQIRLIILALFNRCILKQIDSLYEDINNTLKDAGILPHLKPSVQKIAQTEAKKASQAAKQAQVEANESPEELGEALFSSILDLLGAKRKSQGGGKGKIGSGANRAPDGTIITPAKQGELVSAINKLQPKSTSDHLPEITKDRHSIPNIEIDEQFLQRVKSTLSDERANLYNAVGRERMNALDEDTINLVGMLFEYMLNDPILPNVAKALLSYLHTPYLKATITDRSMLKNTQHVARQLLDSLVEAGSHWVDESNLKQGIYPEMQIAVNRVLKEFDEDHSLFTELLENFRQEMQHFKQKMNILEKRAQEAAMGREKLNIAKQRAKQEIKARLHGAELPRPIKEFLLQSWTDKLIFTLLRHPEGELSADWKESLRLADDLVWVFEPEKTASDEMELEKLLPKIREMIKEGLASLGGYNLEHGKVLFDLLRNPEAIKAATSTESAANADVEIAQNIQHVGKKVLAETEAPTDEESEVPEAERLMMDKIHEIQFGTWFEISTDIPEKTKRVRLSWLSPLTSTCMFVDRAGIQTAIKPLRLLAQELNDGRSKMLEDSSDPFVERTLHAIKRMLKQSLSTPNNSVGNGSSQNGNS